MAGLFSLLRTAWWTLPEDPKASFAGQTIIVTGSNSGLGLEAAAKFVALDASRVILAVRTTGKGDEAVRVIRSRHPDTTCKLEVWELDMASYASIQSFATRVGRNLVHLDVVVLNAGVFMAFQVISEHGWEQTLQVNTLSTTLLALLLLPHLRRLSTSNQKGSPVLELVSSGTHLNAKLAVEEQQIENSIMEKFNPFMPFSGMKQYHMSKLFLMCALASLAKAGAEEPKVRVVSVCPGACSSDLARGYDSAIATFGKWLFGLLFLRTAEQGSRTLVSGTLLGDEARGCFWQHDEIKPQVVDGRQRGQ